MSNQQRTTINPAYVLQEMARRGLTIEQTAERAGIHRNTLSRALAGQPIEILNARRLALVFETHAPLNSLEAMQVVDSVPFPIAIPPMTRRGLASDERVLVLEIQWYELPDEARSQWPNRAARIRGGRGFMHGRDWTIDDVSAFITEQRAATEAVSP